MVVDLAAGDMCLIAFYFLLRAGEYVVKASQEESKQTVQFRLCDVAFFEATDDGMVRQIPPTAPAWRIQTRSPQRCDYLTKKTEYRKRVFTMRQTDTFTYAQ
jgi:hypothetical protein